MFCFAHGIKTYDILTYCIARTVPLFWAPFLTQNLVLVFLVFARMRRVDDENDEIS